MRACVCVCLCKIDKYMYTIYLYQDQPRKYLIAFEIQVMDGVNFAQRKSQGNNLYSFNIRIGLD